MQIAEFLPEINVALRVADPGGVDPDPGGLDPDPTFKKNAFHGSNNQFYSASAHLFISFDLYNNHGTNMLNQNSTLCSTSFVQFAVY